MKRTLIAIFCGLFLCAASSGQVAINTDGSSPNSSAGLDVNFTSKGFLPPRLTTAQRNAIASPAAGLIIYNTDLGQVEYYGGATPGWARLLSPATGWSTTGNAGTDANSFIGTTDASPLRFRVGNLAAGKIDFSSGNVALGGLAGSSVSSAMQMTAIGHNALQMNTTGNGNTALGASAMYSNTSGDYNSVLGELAMYNNLTGDYNTAIGNWALFSNVAGSRAVAVGCEALHFAGSNANATVVGSVAVGYMALRGSTTASANTGTYNVSVGYSSLMNNTSGSSNTAAGTNGLFSNTTGTENTAFGNRALYANTTGSDNTALGHHADVGSSGLTNATAIGANAIVNTSNSLILGNGANVGIGTGSPTEQLHTTLGVRHESLGGTGTRPVLADLNGKLLAGPAGTANYHPKWLNDGTLGATSSIYDNGNVGIGTTAPSAPLQVTASGTGEPSTNGLYVYNPTNTAGQNAVLCARVAGTTGGNPFVALDVNGETGWSMGVDNSNNSLKFSNDWNNLTLSNKMTLLTNGNVGIGTATPGFPLSFSNTLGDKIALYGTAGNNYGMGIQNLLLQVHTDVSTADIAFGYGSSGSFSENMRIRGNGKVGIGTVNPQQKLEVNGNIRQSTYSQPVSVPAGSSATYTWTHNFGYQPVIIISKDQTGGGYLDFVETSYAHVDNNTLTIYMTNRSASTATGTLRWIVVY